MGTKPGKEREMKSKSSDRHCLSLNLSQPVYFPYYKIKRK